jgi:hypothetical protein
MKAYELLADPAHWIKGTSARMGREPGSECSIFDPRATCFCTAGAINKCYGMDTAEPMGKLHKHLQMTIVDWNDAAVRTHDEVIKTLKELDI